jgi:hypothetical protein
MHAMYNIDRLLGTIPTYPSIHSVELKKWRVHKGASTTLLMNKNVGRLISEYVDRKNKDTFFTTNLL